MTWIFTTAQLMDDADYVVFKQVCLPNHCLHRLFPPNCPNDNLQHRVHSFRLTVPYFIKSILLHVPSQYVCVHVFNLYFSVRCQMLCSVHLSHFNKVYFTYLLTYTDSVFALISLAILLLIVHKAIFSLTDEIKTTTHNNRAVHCHSKVYDDWNRLWRP